MANIQQAIDQARKAGVPEEIIAKKVKEYGGSYQAPQQVKSSPTLSVSGPEDLIAQSNLPKPGFFESIGNFLAPTTTANIKDIFASKKSSSYIKSQDENTKKIQELTRKMVEARNKGDTETAKILANQARRLGEMSEEIAAPQFSQYTQDQIAAGQTGNVSDYLLRGVKTGAEIGSYLTPMGKGLGLGQRTGLSALGGGLRGFGSSDVGGEVGGAIGGAALSAGMTLAGNALKWTGNKITEKSIKASGENEKKIMKKFGTTVNDIASKYGKNADELYGPISEKGAGGTLSKASTEAEKIIQETIKNAPKGTKISKDILLNALDKEINLQKEGLNKTMVAGLKKAQKEIVKQYGKDLTPDQALKLLRTANKYYTEAAIGSVEKTKYKIIRESLRKVLGETFEEIDQALKVQSEVIMLRPIIEKEIGKATSKTGQGLFSRAFELDKPTTYPIVGDILKGVGNKVLPATLKTSGDVLQSKLAQEAGVGILSMPESGAEPQISTEIAPQNEEVLETGTLPTPQENIVSEGGQWKWDAAQNDWVPNVQEQVGQTGQTSLTGYMPEELYNAAISAYQNGDSASYKQLMSMYEDETSYQEKQSKIKEKEGKGTATSSIDMMEELYGAGTSQSLSMGKETVGLKGIKARGGVEYKKLSDQNYVDRLNTYKSQMALVAGAINQAAGAGVLNGGEYERLAMESFPNEYTSEAVAKSWFANARKVLNSIPSDRGSELSDYLGGLM